MNFGTFREISGSQQHWANNRRGQNNTIQKSYNVLLTEFLLML